MKRALASLIVAAFTALTSLAQANDVVYYNSSSVSYVNSSLGAATLGLDEGRRLPIHNIGSSGNDGVEISLRTASSVNIFFDPLPASSNGAYIEAHAIGTYNGVCNASIGTLRVTKGGASTYNITADFSDIGSPTQHIRILNGGILVADVAGHSGPVGSMSTWPRRLGKLGGGTDCITVGSDPSTSFLIAGSPTPVIGDEIQVLSESLTGGIKVKTAFQLRAKDVSSLTITDEQVVSAPAPAASPIGLGLLSLLLLGSATWVLRRRPSAIA